MIVRALALSVLIASAAAAQESARGKLLAVLEFNSKLEGADRKSADVQYLADTVRAAVLDAVPDMGVMTRENEMVLLAQTGKKLAECEGECEVDTGRRLGADLVISGDLLKFGSSFKLNLKLHDTHSGRLLSGGQASGRTVDELDADTQIAVRKLLRPLTGETGQNSQTSRTEQRPANAPAPTPAPQQAALQPAASWRGPRLAIGTSSSGKSYDVSVRAGGKTFACANRVTDTAICELYGVPPGDATLVVRGDLNQEHEFRFHQEGLRIMVDARGHWPLYLGLGLLGGGALLAFGGSQSEGSTASLAYAYGALIGAGGLVFLIIGAARSSATYDETTGEALRIGDEGKVKLAGLGLQPVQGGAMASAAFRF